MTVLLAGPIGLITAEYDMFAMVIDDVACYWRENPSSRCQWKAASGEVSILVLKSIIICFQNFREQIFPNFMLWIAFIEFQPLNLNLHRKLGLLVRDNISSYNMWNSLLFFYLKKFLLSSVIWKWNETIIFIR